MKTLTTVATAQALARAVTAPGRGRPVVVLTAAPGTEQPGFDVSEIEQALGGEVEVHLLATADTVRAFGALLPDAAQVYGGGGRAYPGGRAWLDDPARVPMRFPGGAEGVPGTTLLVDDALALLVRSNWRSGRTAVGRRSVTGVVKGSVARRAVVRLEDGTFASITAALTVPDVPLERLVVEGQVVTGVHDPATRWLDVYGSLRQSSQSLKPYKVGRVVLAEVAAVAPDHVIVRLHPDVAVRVERNDAAPGAAQLTSLYTPGDVVRAVVVARPPAWQLRLVDLPDGDPVSAAVLLPGGPAWLTELDAVPEAMTPVALAPASTAPAAPRVSAVPAPPKRRDVQAVPVAPVPSKREREAARLAARETGEPEPKPVEATPAALMGRQRVQLSATPADMTPVRPQPVAQAPAQALAAKPAAPKPAAPKPAPLTSPSGAVRLPSAGLKGSLKLGETPLGGSSSEVASLLHEFALLERDRTRLEARVEALSEQLRDQRAQLRKATTARTEAAPAVFADPEFGFRHEVLGAWARRVPVAEQLRLPLGEFAIGAEFLPSVTRLGAPFRDKVLDVTVEIVCGLAPLMPSREVHRYRASESGGSPYVTRADGAALWRASLQSGTAAARRIHYWILPGGTVELCHVGTHDERPPH